MAKETGHDQNGRALPTKVMLTIRTLVGVYLIYTAYSLIGGVVNGEGRDKYFFGAFIIFFAITGVFLMIYSGRALMQGRYIGGAMDPTPPEEEDIEEDAIDRVEIEEKEEAEDSNKEL